MVRLSRYFSIVCVFLLIGSVDPPAYKAETEESVQEGMEQVSETDHPEGEEETVFEPPANVAHYDIEQMEKVAETEALALYFDEERAGFAVKQKESSHVWYSNPSDRDFDPLASPENKGLLYSQIVIDYFNPNGQTSRFDSYKDSVMKEQVEYEAIENGMKVTFTFGDAEKGIEQIPQLISKERFQTLILDKIEDEKTKKDMEKRFKYIEEDEVYERRDAAFSKVILKRSVELLQEIGYTEEQVAIDHEEHGIEGGEEQAYPFFVIPMLIQIEKDALTVQISGEEIEYNELYPIHKLRVLPFFGAAGVKEEGYMFIPDGSGALIHLNNGKEEYQPYSSRVYGRDEAMFRRTDSLTSETIRLPVFGLKQGDHGFLGIIEKGDGIAQMEADVSGRLNSYNSVFSSFILKESGEITMSGGDRSSTVYIYQKGEYKESIKLKYVFLEGENANYTGMARYYQQYLRDKGELQPLTEEENIPFFLELTGSIWKRKTILGIPYKSLEPLTTFEEAEQIVNELMDANVNNIKVRYSGWFNEGVNHKLPTRIKVDRKIGGKEDLLAFHEFLKQHNAKLYPDVAFSHVYHNTLEFRPTKDASRFINRKVAEIYSYNLATYRRDSNSRSPYYLLSPTRLPDYVDTFMAEYADFEIANISLRDVGEKVHSDFREKNVVNREQAKEIATEQLKKIHENIPHILTVGGNVTTLPYSDSILEVPLSNSGFNITDESIPFYQMIVHGHADYAGQPINLSSNQNSRHQLLKALETGSNPYFSWFYEGASVVKETEFNHFISSHYAEWLEEATEMYQQLNETLRHVRHQPITSYHVLKEGVTETTYGEDYSIIVNYNNKAAVIDGMTVEAESYKIRQGE